MGAKTSLLAYADGSFADVLRTGAVAPPEDTGRLIDRVFPGWAVRPAAGRCLREAVHPSGETAYAGAFPGAGVVCHRSLTSVDPARMPEHLLELGRGRRLVLHVMHSASDALTYGPDGTLVETETGR